MILKAENIKPAPISPSIINTSKLGILALQIAQSQVGQREDPIGSNSGKMVDQYLQSVGLKPGYAWCRAFVYWCFNEAVKQLAIPNPLIKTAGVMDGWNRTEANKKVAISDVRKNVAEVAAGDVFVLSFGALGHTGIVEKVEGSMLHTIEGNSNSTGGREGYEVVRHTRTVDDIHLIGFTRY